MGDLIALQRWLYAHAVHALQDLHAAGPNGVPVLVLAAFGFGMLHALLPGHGKAVLASYYAGDGRLRGAVASSCLLIVVHVGTAVLMVLTGFLIVERTIGAAGRSLPLERASQVLVVLIGLWLLFRAARWHTHNQGHSGLVLAVVTGLVPCPLTTFIMTYAVVNGLIGSGLILSAAFAVGMIVTVTLFPALAVLLRSRLLPPTGCTASWRGRLAHAIEVGAALAVVTIGLWPLLPL